MDPVDRTLNHGGTETQRRGTKAGIFSVRPWVGGGEEPWRTQRATRSSGSAGRSPTEAEELEFEGVGRTFEGGVFAEDVDPAPDAGLHQDGADFFLGDGAAAGGGERGAFFFLEGTRGEGKFGAAHGHPVEFERRGGICGPGFFDSCDGTVGGGMETEARLGLWGGRGGAGLDGGGEGGEQGKGKHRKDRFHGCERSANAGERERGGCARKTRNARQGERRRMGRGRWNRRRRRKRRGYREGDEGSEGGITVGEFNYALHGGTRKNPMDWTLNHGGTETRRRMKEGIAGIGVSTWAGRRRGANGQARPGQSESMTGGGGAEERLLDSEDAAEAGEEAGLVFAGEFVLPDADDFPALGTKRFGHKLVARLIAGDFFQPELGVVLWFHTVLRAALSRTDELPGLPVQRLRIPWPTPYLPPKTNRFTTKRPDE